MGAFGNLRRWQEFLEVSGRCNENTRRQYRRYLVGFLADVCLELEDITEDDVVAHLAGQDPHGQMRGMTLRSLKSFFSWAADRGVVPTDPCRKLTVARPKYGEAPSLEPDELERVLQAASKLDPRARPTLELAYATGARLGSLCAVTAADVNLQAGWISFRTAKGDAPYGVPLGERGKRAVEQLLALADYMPPKVSHRRPTLVGVGPGSVSAWARKAGEAAGVRAYTHLLRHTFATRIASDPNVDIRTFIELMNHADGSMLRRYAKRSDANLRRAVAGL